MKMNNEMDLNKKEQECFERLKTMLININNLLNLNENSTIYNYVKNQIETVNNEKNINLKDIEYENLEKQLNIQIQKSIVIFVISVYSNNTHYFTNEEIASIFDNILTKFILLLFTEMNVVASYFVYLITFIQDFRLIKYIIVEYSKYISVIIK